MSFTAKSIVIDIADVWLFGDYLGIRSVEFKLAGVLVQVAAADITCYATSFYVAGYDPWRSFDTGLSKTGGAFDNCWFTLNNSNQRLICVFDTPIEFDEIVINNFHNSGGQTNYGAKNVKIHLSSDAITSTVYDQAIANSDLLFDGVFTEHAAADATDDESLVLIAIITITAPPLSATADMSSDAPVILAYDNPSILFFFTLAGAANGLEDVLIPIKSFQARHRAGKPSYLSVTIPGSDHSSEISARPNGEMVVRMGKVHQGAVYHSEEILRVDLEEIRRDDGARTRSITLTGHGTATYGNKIVNLQGVTYRPSSAGKLRFRLSTPDIFLRPGDTAVYDGDSILVDNISYTVDESRQQMEVAE